MRDPRTLQAIACLALLATVRVAAQSASDVMFEDGFEPACYGIANDRPGCVVVPFNQPPLTLSIRNSGVAEWTRIDAYVLLDLSGSMTGEVAALRNGLGAATLALACPPQGTGTPGMCFRDPWWGAGTFAYQGSMTNAYRNHMDLQPTPNFSVIPTAEPAGCCEETLLSMFSTVTALGAAGSGCVVPNGHGPRLSCAGSPAANAGATTFGYPCFREDAAPFAVVFSDETPSLNLNCPMWATGVRPQFLARGVRFIGISGSGSPASLVTEFQMFANDTGAVDQINGNAPLVFDGSGNNSPVAFTNAMLAVRRGLPMQVTAVLIDDPVDAVDTSAFVQRIEVVNDGSNGCSIGASVSDSNGDGFDDTFAAIPGDAVCFRLLVASNTSIAAGAQLQQFPAILRIRGDGRMPIVDTRVWFVVPPG